MKSFKQLQQEVIDRADKNGGYPKAVFSGGFVFLASNEEEEKSFLKSHMISFVIFGVCLLLFLLLFW